MPRSAKQTLSQHCGYTTQHSLWHSGWEVMSVKHDSVVSASAQTAGFDTNVLYESYISEVIICFCSFFFIVWNIFHRIFGYQQLFQQQLRWWGLRKPDKKKNELKKSFSQWWNIKQTIWQYNNITLITYFHKILIAGLEYFYIVLIFLHIGNFLTTNSAVEEYIPIFLHHTCTWALELHETQYCRRFHAITLINSWWW